MIRLKSPCRYCNRRYVGCHSLFYDYFMFRCWVEWFNNMVREIKEAEQDYKACCEETHRRLKHWDKKIKRG